MFGIIHLHTLCPCSLQEVEQQPLSIHHLHDMPYIQRTGGGRQHQRFHSSPLLLPNVSCKVEVEDVGVICDLCGRVDFHLSNIIYRLIFYFNQISGN